MQPQTGAQAGGPAAAAEVVMSSLHGGLQWAVDRMLSIVYGLVYDYIFEQFGPYQQLQAEVLELVENSASTSDIADRRAYQIARRGLRPRQSHVRPGRGRASPCWASSRTARWSSSRERSGGPSDWPTWRSARVTCPAPSVRDAAFDRSSTSTRSTRTPTRSFCWRTRIAC